MKDLNIIGKNDNKLNVILYDVIEKLFEWVKRENYMGWDPYDALSGNITRVLAKNKLLGFLLIQMNLYSPINFRPILRIKKNISNKGVSLFAQAYLNLYKLTGLEKFKSEAKNLLKLLESKAINKNGYYCWASYYYDFISIKHYLGPNIPDAVGTTNAVNSFLLGYEIFQDKHYLDMAKSAVKFMISELLEQEPYGFHFKYTPIEKEKIVFNVTALALHSITKLLSHDYDEELVKITNEAVNFLLQFQTERGAWPYSIYIHSKFLYKQIDYHQGFILDGLLSTLLYLNEDLKQKTIEALLKGVKYYKEYQFTKEGISYYRYPMKFPIDIHNQAQGIITFSNFSKLEDSYLDFAKRIALWTINNMLSDKGYFYTHKWPFIINKIPYMRWGQAWMMLALTVFLLKLTEITN